MSKKSKQEKQLKAIVKGLKSLGMLYYSTNEVTGKKKACFCAGKLAYSDTMYEVDAKLKLLAEETLNKHFINTYGERFKLTPIKRSRNG